MSKVVLEKPLTVGERTIVELTFQSPKVRHILAADGLDPKTNAYVVAMAASLTGEAEAMIRALEPEDWVKVHIEVQQVYSRFIGLGRVEIITALAMELQPEQFRRLIKDYLEVYELKPEMLLPTPTKGAE